MFISHWFQRSGIDQVWAPVHPEDTTDIENAMGSSQNDDDPDATNDEIATNDNHEKVSPRKTTRIHNIDGQEETPIFDFLAPRAPKMDNNNGNNGNAVETVSVPPAEVFSQSKTNNVANVSAVQGSSGMVCCQHCHQMTPISPPPSTTPASSRTMTAPTAHPDNVQNHDYENYDPNDNVDIVSNNPVVLKVVHAAKLTNKTNTAPKFEYERIRKAFGYCTTISKKSVTYKSGVMGKQGTKKKKTSVESLQKMLQVNPELIYARSAKMGDVVDGFSLLHAACYAGNEEVVDYLLREFVIPSVTEEAVHEAGLKDDEKAKESDDAGEYRESSKEEKKEEAKNENVGGNNGIDRLRIDLEERDLQGRTAQHVAADQGHLGVLELLSKAFEAVKDEENCYDSDGDESDDENYATVSTKTTSDAVTQTTPLTKTQITPKTPRTVSKRSGKTPGKTSNTKSPTRANRATPKSNIFSPTKPKSSKKTLSPSFCGRNVAVDLSGRSPLAYALQSTNMAAKKNRKSLEGMLYSKDDPSIVGTRSPPKFRCGGGRGVVGAGFSGANPFLSSPDSSDDGSCRGPSPLQIRPRQHYTPSKTPHTPYHTPFQSPPSTGRRLQHELDNECGRVSGIKNGAMSTVPEDGNANIDTSSSSIPLIIGMSDMPGKRVEQEDAVCWHYPIEAPLMPQALLASELNAKSASTPSNNTTLGLFGVFDGHGDGGFASQYIADKLLDKLEENPLWPVAYYTCNNCNANNTVEGKQSETNDSNASLSSILIETCHSLDGDLKTVQKQKGMKGGTTAIMALVSDAKIFVANIGDSRCILVKKKRKVSEGNSSETVAETIAGDNNCSEKEEKIKDVDEPKLVEESADETVNAHQQQKSDDDNTTSKGSKDGNIEIDFEVVALSEDHKADLPVERARIESAGLSIHIDHIPPKNEDDKGTAISKVKKSSTELLAMSRAFGDHEFKSNTDLPPSRQAVVCTPDVVVRDRIEEDDMYMVLACDGIWDVMSNEEVGEFVVKRVEELTGGQEEKTVGEENLVEGALLAKVCDDLLDLCLEKDSEDNMTVVIVALPASGLFTFSSSSLPARALAF